MLNPSLNGCEALQSVTAMGVQVGKAALYYEWLCGAPGVQVGRVDLVVQECCRHGGRWARTLILIS